jgi:hypothetical protein
MSFDSELNLAWECREDGALSSSIGRVRARLMCEHAGIEHDAQLELTHGVVARIDELIGHSKLRLRALPDSPDSVPQTPLLEQAFDPEKALTELEPSELLEPILEPRLRQDRA